MKARGAGITLRAARAKHNLSQLELAVRAGLALNTISNFERGARISKKSAEKLSAVLGLKAAALLAEGASHERR